MPAMSNATGKISARPLRGIKDSRVLEDRQSFTHMASIPNIRVIIVIRDPIDAFESRYNANECWRLMQVDEMLNLGVADCLDGRGWNAWSQQLDQLFEVI